MNSPEVDEKLKKGKVLVVGCGGLGSSILMNLATAGVGHIGIVDSDIVDRTNLQRQVIHGVSDLGKKKVLSAKEKISRLNPNVNITLYEENFNEENGEEWVKEYDVVVDGTDNVRTRYIINELCSRYKKPYVYASVLGFEGRISVFYGEQTPCYQCLFPDPPETGEVPTGAQKGILNSLPGVAGSLEALQVIDLLCKGESSLMGKLLIFDLKEMKFRTISLKKSQTCKICANLEGG